VHSSENLDVFAHGVARKEARYATSPRSSKGGASGQCQPFDTQSAVTVTVTALSARCALQHFTQNRFGHCGRLRS
jgi:hypothetical protein